MTKVKLIIHHDGQFWQRHLGETEWFYRSREDLQRLRAQLDKPDAWCHEKRLIEEIDEALRSGVLEEAT